MKITKEALTGFIFLVLGLGALAVGSQYRLGSLTAMGPGYFPMLLCGLVAILGAIITVRAYLSSNDIEPLATFHLRPLAIITVSVLAFGFLIERLGLIVAIACLVLISGAAMRRRGFVEPLVLFLVLTAIALVIFVMGLNIPIKVWPR